jgi:hypothetical protein
MALDLDLLAQNGIVTATAFDPELAQVVAMAPADHRQPPAAGLSEPFFDACDPQLAAYWMWTFGTPAAVRAAGPGEYVAPVSARNGADFVEGTDYLTQVQLGDYLAVGGANDNWLMRRVK